jgi:curli production assembly/transport component CsgF
MKLFTSFRLHRSPRLSLCLGCALSVLAAGVQATEMVYTPLIPAFGGNPNNAAGFLANAAAQNSFKAPVNTPLQNFNKSLEQAILNRLVSQSVASIFGTQSKLVPGSYDTGNYTVDIQDSGNGTLTVTTTDKKTGDQVTFTLQTNDIATGP